MLAGILVIDHASTEVNNEFFKYSSLRKQPHGSNVERVLSDDQHQFDETSGESEPFTLL